LKDFKHSKERGTIELRNQNKSDKEHLEEVLRFKHRSPKGTMNGSYCTMNLRSKKISETYFRLIFD
jgi:hypothetical protein